MISYVILILGLLAAVYSEPQELATENSIATEPSDVNIELYWYWMFRGWLGLSITIETPPALEERTSAICPKNPQTYCTAEMDNSLKKYLDKSVKWLDRISSTMGQLTMEPDDVCTGVTEQFFDRVGISCKKYVKATNEYALSVWAATVRTLGYSNAMVNKWILGSYCIGCNEDHYISEDQTLVIGKGIFDDLRQTCVTSLDFYEDIYSATVKFINSFDWKKIGIQSPELPDHITQTGTVCDNIMNGFKSMDFSWIMSFIDDLDLGSISSTKSIILDGVRGTAKAAIALANAMTSPQFPVSQASPQYSNNYIVWSDSNSNGVDMIAVAKSSPEYNTCVNTPIKKSDEAAEKALDSIPKDGLEGWKIAVIVIAVVIVVAAAAVGIFFGVKHMKTHPNKNANSSDKIEKGKAPDNQEVRKPEPSSKSEAHPSSSGSSSSTSSSSSSSSASSSSSN